MRDLEANAIRAAAERTDRARERLRANVGEGRRRAREVAVAELALIDVEGARPSRKQRRAEATHARHEPELLMELARAHEIAVALRLRRWRDESAEHARGLRRSLDAKHVARTAGDAPASFEEPDLVRGKADAIARALVLDDEPCVGLCDRSCGREAEDLDRSVAEIAQTETEDADARATRRAL